jgi:hypothetical protein
MYKPSNLSSKRHFEWHLELAEAARSDLTLESNHIEAKIPDWLDAFGRQCDELLSMSVDGNKEIFDEEFVTRLKKEQALAEAALTAYPNFQKKILTDQMRDKPRR